MTLPISGEGTNIGFPVMPEARFFERLADVRLNDTIARHYDDAAKREDSLGHTEQAAKLARLGMLYRSRATTQSQPQPA